MITTTVLREYTSKDLAQMAKKKGIAGWHSMRKDDLIKALVREARKTTSPKKPSTGRNNPRKATAATLKNGVSNGSSTNGKNGHNGTLNRKPTLTRTARRIRKAQIEIDKMKDVTTSDGQKTERDRVVLMVRDPYWLHANWELSSAVIQRAKAAMAEHWHTAKPVLRLYEVETGTTTSTIEGHVRDITIHGGVNNWYIDVANPPNGYRVELGYLSSSGRFHCVARSNIVCTPSPGSADDLDENWSEVAKNYDKIYALSGGYSPENTAGNTSDIQDLFEERLRRPMGSPMVTRFGVGALGVKNAQDLEFDIEAEMIVYGSAKADAYVTLSGEPVKLRADGTFTVRLSLPDRRQVLPIVASTSDGTKQQTIVLAIERNTKVMEPVLRDSGE